MTIKREGQIQGIEDDQQKRTVDILKSFRNDIDNLIFRAENVRCDLYVSEIITVILAPLPRLMTFVACTRTKKDTNWLK